MKKKFFVVGLIAVLGIFYSCDFDDGSSKKTVTLTVNSTDSDRTWFMAASLDSSDISASDVPYFDFNSATRVAKNNVQNENLENVATLPTKLRKYDENISRKNQEIAKNLVNGNNSRTAFDGKSNVTKEFNSENSTTNIYLISNDENSLTKESATKEYEGTYCNVFFVDNTNGKVTETSLSSYKKDSSSTEINVFETLGSLFDVKIYPNITNILGSFSYTTSYSDVISCPSKVNIVIADLYYDYSETESTKAGTQGYYWAGDMVTEYPNQDAIIYLDSWFIQNNPESVYSTLAHEFNHMLNYMNKSFSKQLAFSTWYTEMLSGLADAMFENYLVEDLKDDDSIYMQRLPFFNTFYNLGFSNWRSTNKYFNSGSSGSDVYISYGNVFVFGDFLAKNYGGFNLIKEIATNSYVDETSIVTAVNKINGTSFSFSDIIKKFSCIPISNFFNDDSLCTLNKKVEYSGNSSIYLKAIQNKSYYYSGNQYSISNSAVSVLNDNTGNTKVALGQYGFIVYGYSDSAITSINAVEDTDYNASAYTIIGKQVSLSSN